MALKRIDRTYRGKPTHHYELDGEKVSGVTTILSDALPKPALLPWGIKSVAEYAADHLDRLVEMQPMGREAIVSALKQAPYTDRDTAAKRGTEVHSLAEKLIHGEEVDVPEELAGHVDSYVRFLDDWKPQPVLTEVVVGSRRWRYAGSLDLIADLPDGRRVIADVKTTRSGIYGETALQVAAYRYAEFYLDAEGNEQSMADLGITDAFAIHVTGNGYSVHPLAADEDAFKTFQHACFMAGRIKALKGLVGAPLAPGEVTA
jgi:hypothetical protein